MVVWPVRLSCQKGSECQDRSHRELSDPRSAKLPATGTVNFQATLRSLCSGRQTRWRRRRTAATQARACLHHNPRRVRQVTFQLFQLFATSTNCNAFSSCAFCCSLRLRIPLIHPRPALWLLLSWWSRPLVTHATDPPSYPLGPNCYPWICCPSLPQRNIAQSLCLRRFAWARPLIICPKPFFFFVARPARCSPTLQVNRPLFPLKASCKQGMCVCSSGYCPP